MAETKYTEEHEWIRVEGDVGTIGITDYAQKVVSLTQALGDVVYIEVPEVGTVVEREGAFA